ncbi:XPG N terminal domain [Trypanosoma vivax]|nr:hypothetical protein TRVL_00021 [Trypanosoma vivax]KAH8608937.1 XPG N terminal domain [Trypanosoma vivax]
MGIKGLWPEVRPVCHKAHISQFRGQSVAVDMYVWLHRGIIGSIEVHSVADFESLSQCTDSLSGPSSTPPASGAEVASQECLIPVNTRILCYVTDRLELLLRCGVKPVLVFDGAPIPMKHETEIKRRQNRAAYFDKALQLMRGSSSTSRSWREVVTLLEKAMNISTELAHIVILLLQDRRMECIVAPYEADAQLAYLCRKGYVQAVITEDSDLIAYHCPCLIAKLDSKGNCEVLNVQDLRRCETFAGLSYQAFLVGCILSGCDYLPNLPGIGVKKAFDVVKKADSISAIIYKLKMKHGFTEEEIRQYEVNLRRAYYCFAHHFVFDPNSRKVLHLTPLPARTSLKTSILGESLSEEMAQKICAECLYDPVTRVLYKGTYQYCLEQYQRRMRGGHVPLPTVKGFQKMHSPRVVLNIGKGAVPGADAPEQLSVGVTPLHSSPATTPFPAPLQKLFEASGYHGSRLVVRSKYFAAAERKTDDWDDDCFVESSQRAEDRETCTVAAGASLAKTLVGGPCGTSHGGEAPLPTPSSRIPEGSGAGQPLIQSPSCSKKNQDEGERRPSVVPTHSATEVPGDVQVTEMPIKDAVANIGGSGSERCQEGVGSPPCPFGYTQCGRPHSIFEQCFLGKGWSKGSSHSPSNGRDTGGMEGRGSIVRPPLSRPELTAGVKRSRPDEMEPVGTPYRPTFRPPGPRKSAMGDGSGVPSARTPTESIATQATAFSADAQRSTLWLGEAAKIGGVDGKESKRSSLEIAQTSTRSAPEVEVDIFRKLAFAQK